MAFGKSFRSKKKLAIIKRKQIVEDMPEFKACYTDRDKAREDFLAIKNARTSTEK